MGLSPLKYTNQEDTPLAKKFHTFLGEDYAGVPRHFWPDSVKKRLFLDFQNFGHNSTWMDGLFDCGCKD